MTVIKTGISSDKSELQDGDLYEANASDVTTPLSDLETYIKAGRLGVSDDDTHLGTLEEKLVVSGTGIVKTEVDDGADETLQLALSTALEALNALLPSSGKIRASAIDSQSSTSGYVLTADGAGNASFAAVGGGGAQPVDVTGTAGEALSEREMVFLDESDGEWYKLDVDATGSVLAGALRGCVNESGGISSSATGSIRIFGEVSGFTGLTPWGRMYASTTAGGYTQTRPSVTDGGGQVAIAEMGYATSATAILIMPKPIRYIKRETLANNGTMTIEHHSDAQSRQREVRAYIGTTVAGSSLVSYSDSNQDVDVPLRDKTPLGYGSDECSGGTASSSSGTASEAFDDDSGTSCTYSSLSAGWLKYDFGVSNEKTIQQYTVESENDGRAIRDWTFEGSNDDSSWDVLDTQSSITWSTPETKTFTFSNSTAYRYYRVNFTDNNGGSTTKIVEVEMKESSGYVDGDDKLAQSFEVSGEQNIKTVDLQLKKVGSPTGDLSLEIQTDSGGEPSGTPVTNGTATVVDESTLSTSYGDITFTFATAPVLSDATTYWLVLSTDRSASETNYVAWGADGSSPSYADGEMMSEVSSTWSAESKDAVFEVFAEGTQYDEPCVIGRWSGGTRDCAVRFDDGSASDPNTKTTFKNVTGGSVDMVAEVEVA